MRATGRTLLGKFLQYFQAFLDKSATKQCRDARQYDAAEIVRIPWPFPRAVITTLSRTSPARSLCPVPIDATWEIHLEAEQTRLLPRATKTMQASVRMRDIDSRLAWLAKEVSCLRTTIRESRVSLSLQPCIEQIQLFCPL